jgi:hypothetical protein
MSCSWLRRSATTTSATPARSHSCPAINKWADDVVWRNLVEGHLTVLVGEETELLLVPLRRGLIDRLRGRVTVNVGHRVHGHATLYVTSSTLGRHPVREMRELAHA